MYKFHRLVFQITDTSLLKLIKSISFFCASTSETLCFPVQIYTYAAYLSISVLLKTGVNIIKLHIG